MFINFNSQITSDSDSPCPKTHYWVFLAWKQLILHFVYKLSHFGNITELELGIRYIPNFISESEEQQLLQHIYASPKPKWRQLLNRRLQNWGGMVGGNQCLIQDEPLPKWLEECIDKIMTLQSIVSAEFHHHDHCKDTNTYSYFPSDKRPNHVLINEYLPGQGIMPHTDGPAFFSLISTISLGSYTLLELYDEQMEMSDKAKCAENRNNDQNSFNGTENITNRKFVGSLFLERRSLVLISGPAYQLLHGIAERKTDRINAEQILNWDMLGEKPVNCLLDRNDAGDDNDNLLLTRGTRVSLTIRNVPNVKNFKLFVGSRR